MCAELGIRHAYTQAYNHRANGRVERAGQEILERLRKLKVSENVNWVEALPRVIDRYHDIPGRSGLSPYEILFGRSRPLAGRRYTPPTDCEDANNFFRRMREIDLKVARVMNELHDRECAKYNQNVSDYSDLEILSKVWYRRPLGSADKLASRWLGPCIVVGKEGEYSYLIENKEDNVIKAHRIFLKPDLEDKVYGKPLEHFFHKRVVQDTEGFPDEWIVERILGHRKVSGKWQFLTKWEGFHEKDAQWEPVGSFIHRYSAELVRYCKERGLINNVIDYLSPVADVDVIQVAHLCVM